MKKGQITIYMIAGLLALFLLSLFIMILRKDDTELLVDNVPKTYKRFQEYVVQCAKITSTDAIIRLGQSGGYISLEEQGYTDKTFDLNSIPTESDVLFISEKQPVPYWWYMKSDNDCSDCYVTVENIPTQEQMENQISRYVATNIDACLNDFQPFKEQGYQIDMLEKPYAETDIKEDSVTVRVRYPMQVKIGPTSVHMENFGTDIDAPLFRNYELATNIVLQEANTQLLENMTMNLIAYNSAPREDMLPPLSHIDSKQYYTFWIKEDVRQKLMDILTAYVPVLRVKGTTNGIDIRSDNKYEDAFFRSAIIPNNLSVESTVSFIYAGWPIYFEISPSEGQLLTSHSYRRDFPFNMVPPIQTNHYEFFYDISYPVLIDIHDEHAFNNKGFDFIFAMEANIRDNKNLLQWHKGEGTIGPWDFSGTSFSENKGLADDEPMKRLDAKTMMCRSEQRIAGPVRLSLKNKKNNNPAGKASLTFICGRYEKCMLQTTDDKGVFDSFLPICTGGALLIEKQGYEPKVIELDTAYGKTMNITINLEQEHKLHARVKTIGIVKNENTYSLYTPQDLKSTEYAILTIEKMQENTYDPPYNKILRIDPSKNETFEIVPGDYSVKATMFDSAGIITEAYSRNISGYIVSYPSINMTPALIGGAELTETTGKWTVTESDLTDDTVIFPILKAAHIRKIDDMEILGEIENLSKTYRKQLEPVFAYDNR